MDGFSVIYKYKISDSFYISDANNMLEFDDLMCNLTMCNVLKPIIKVLLLTGHHLPKLMLGLTNWVNWEIFPLKLNVKR